MDQATSSLTNLIPGLYAAHALTVSDFGLFGLIQVSFVLVLGAVRACSTEVVLADPKLAKADGLGAVDLPVVAVVVTALVGVTLVFMGVTTAGLVWASIAVVSMLVQDALRLLAFALGRAAVALFSDVLWLVGTVVVLSAAWLGAIDTSLESITLAWAGPSAVGALVSAALLGWAPRLMRGARLLRNQRKQASVFLADWALRYGSAQIATYGLGLLGGLSSVAGIRAAQLILGPVNVIFQGLQLAVTPSAARLVDIPSRLSATLRRLSVALGAGALTVGLVAYALPVNVTTRILGDQAGPMKAVVLPLAIALTATGLMTGSNIGLRILRAGRALIVARSTSAAITLLGGAVGLWGAGSPLGGLWGLGIGSLVAVALWEGAFASVLRRQKPDAAGVVRRP